MVVLECRDRAMSQTPIQSGKNETKWALQCQISHCSLFTKRLIPRFLIDTYLWALVLMQRYTYLLSWLGKNGSVDNFSIKTCLKRVVLFLNCYPTSRIKTETCNAVLRKLLRNTCRELRVRKHRRPWRGWTGFKHLRDCFRNWRKTPFKRGAARRAPLHPPGVPPLWHSLLTSPVNYSSTNRSQLSPWKN